jgi:hypothetical protein
MPVVGEMRLFFDLLDAPGRTFRLFFLSPSGVEEGA